MADIAEMQKDVQRRHQEVLNMLEGFYDITSSDRASSVCQILYFGEC